MKTPPAEEAYQKGFIDGVHATGAQTEEIMAEREEKARERIVTELIRKGEVFDTKVFAIPYARQKYEEIINEVLTDATEERTLRLYEEHRRKVINTTYQRRRKRTRRVV